MPYRRFDWHQHISEVWGEYWSAREAVDRLRSTLVATPDLFRTGSIARGHLQLAHRNLEGTYIVRLFASFEAALRSYDCAVHGDPNRNSDAAAMIDQIGGRRVRRMPAGARDGAHQVRRVRNFWAHESDANPGAMTIDEARARLQVFLSKLPEEWD